MAQDLYGVVPPEMGASMSFESTLGHTQPPDPEYELKPMYFSSTTPMGSNSMAPPPPPPNEGSLTDNMYNGIAKEPVSEAPGSSLIGLYVKNPKFRPQIRYVLVLKSAISDRDVTFFTL